MKIAIGCDPNAQFLKEYLLATALQDGEYEIKDFGSEDPVYANVAIDVSESVARGEFDRAILLCGTGIGVSISANKVKGAYAALANDVYSAKKAVTSNNANILCIGAFTVGRAIAEEIVRAYLSSNYKEGTASAEKLARYVDYDRSK